MYDLSKPIFQIVSLGGDNFHDLSTLFSGKKIPISNCRLLKFLPSMLSVKIRTINVWDNNGIYIDRKHALWGMGALSTLPKLMLSPSEKGFTLKGNTVSRLFNVRTVFQKGRGVQEGK